MTSNIFCSPYSAKVCFCIFEFSITSSKNLCWRKIFSKMSMSIFNFLTESNVKSNNSSPDINSVSNLTSDGFWDNLDGLRTDIHRESLGVGGHNIDTNWDDLFSELVVDEEQGKGIGRGISHGMASGSSVPGLAVGNWLEAILPPPMITEVLFWGVVLMMLLFTVLMIWKCCSDALEFDKYHDVTENLSEGK